MENKIMDIGKILEHFCEQELVKSSIDKYIEALSEVTGKDVVGYTQPGCDMEFESWIDIETSTGEKFRLRINQIEQEDK